MKNTKTKYNSNTIGVEFNQEELEYIKKYYKEIYSLPKHILEELRLWISYVCDKYNLKYNDIMHLKKYQIWLLLLKLENDNNR